MEQTILNYCAQLGKDPLLVQGSGGNISWKENDVLWVKSSGAWLADALTKAIFVPVNLKHLNLALKNADYSVMPQVLRIEACEESGTCIDSININAGSSLRPSIETILHGLMPQKIVIHLHAIDVLTYLVQKNGARKLLDNLDFSVNTILVDYYKPGPDLARAIHRGLKQEAREECPKHAQVAFLKNHGVVIGSETLEELDLILNSLIGASQKNGYHLSLPDNKYEPVVPKALQADYRAFPDIQLHHLVLDPNLFERLKREWVLYPDHAVFLGEKAFLFSSWEVFITDYPFASEYPELIFIQNEGVFVSPAFNKTKVAQLRCYYDVITRIRPETVLDPLSQGDVKTLLEWEAEKIRQQMAK